MKPTLYPAGETAFTSNGLGRLSPIMCRVTHERNGQFDLEMDIRIDDKHFADLAEEKIIYAPYDNTGVCQPFDIYKITKAMEGVVTVYANHVYYRTVKTTVMPCSALSCAASMQAVENSVVGDEMFELTTDMTTQGRFEVDKPQPMRNILFGQRGSLLDVYGGEFVFDHFRIHLSSAAGSKKNVTLRYGKNLTKLEKTTDASNVWTGIVPYWQGSEGTDQELVTLPEEAVYANTVTSHPYKMVIPVDLSSRFSEKPSVEALRAAATQYVNSNVKTAIPSSMDVSFIQLWETEEYKNIANLERVSLCDTISIEHAQLGISVKAKITKTVYDVINERYESMTIGDVRAGLGATIEAAANAVEEKAVSKTALQAALEAATKLINGGLGGHVVINTDDNGHPNEILVMDQPDKAAAVNVIRINKNGIGFSQNGYAGLFNSAWTIDGKFVADYITAGTLNAAIIKAGILTDSAGKNFWDMTTGEFSLSANSTVGGQTVSNIATSAASSAVNGQTQQSIFNKLTNNGQTQGIYLKDGKLYLNGTYLQAGIINIKDENDVSTFYANTQTGVVHIVAKTFKLISGDTTKTIPEIANERASAAVNAQTQESIFNKLTNNGVTQGIYLDNGKLYINGEFIKAKSVSASLIKGGVLELGGSGNGNGSFVVYGASGTEIGRFDKDGLVADEKFKLTRGQYDFFVCDDFTELRTLYGINFDPPGFSCGNYYMTMTPIDGVKILDHYTPSDPLYIEPNYEGQMWGRGHIDDYFMSKNDMPNHTDSGTYLQRIYRFKKDYIIRIGKRQSATNGAIEMTNSMYLALNDKHFYWGSNKFYPDETTLPSTSDGATRELKLNESMFSFRVSTSIFGYVNSDGLYIKGGSKYIRLTDSYTQINGKTVAFESSSAKRYKHDIKPIEDADLDPHRLLALRIVQFRWNSDHPLQYEDMRDRAIPGIIAEDIEEIYPSAVIHKDGQVESWDERRLIPGMLALIQEQDKKIKSLEERLAKIERAWKEMRC